MDEKLIELFEAYLSKELDIEAVTAFENKLKSNAAFKADFDLYNDINASLAYKFNAVDAENKLRKSLNEIQKSSKIKKQPKVISMFTIRKMAIAASVILLVTLSVYRFNSKPSFEDFAQYDDLSLVVRGDDETQKKMLEKYFNDKQFAKTLPLFDDLLKDNPNDNKLLLYKALALVETNKSDEALSVFDQLITNGSPVYKDNALWYKSLTYLKLKDYKACKTTLAKLSSDSDYKDEAQKLMKSL